MLKTILTHSLLIKEICNSCLHSFTTWPDFPSTFLFLSDDHEYGTSQISLSALGVVGGGFTPQNFPAVFNPLLDLDLAQKKKKFQCPMCPKVFSDRPGLYFHKKAIHEKQTFTCSCGKTYIHKRSMSYHQKTCSAFLASCQQ